VDENLSLLKVYTSMKLFWYQIVSLSKSTYMLYKLDNKQGCRFLPHRNKGTHKIMYVNPASGVQCSIVD
jgi:hypothetical protein